MSSVVGRRQNTLAPEPVSRLAPSEENTVEDGTHTMTQTRAGQMSTGLGSLGSRSTAATTSTTASTFGSRWGDNNIWSTSPFGNGFGSSSSRDNRPLPDALSVKTDQADAVTKTGSGLLVDSSTSDDWNAPRPSTRDTSQARAGAQASFADVGLGHQPHGIGGNPYQASNPTARNNTTFASRPTPINISSSNGTATRPTFNSNFTSPVTSRGSEQAPAVYTKYDRPSPSTQYRSGDVDTTSWADASTAQSSLDDRRSNAGSSYVSHASLPVSRNSSLPPSRHSDDQPSDLASFGHYTADSFTGNGLMYSTQSNGNYSGHLDSRSAQLPLQFGQLSMNGDGRGGSSRNLGVSVNGYQNVGIAQNNASLRQNRQDYGRFQYQPHPYQEFATNGHVQFGASAQIPQPLANSKAAYAGLQNGIEPLYNGRLANGRTEPLGASDIESRRDSGHDRDIGAQNGFIPAHGDQSMAMLQQRLRTVQDSQAMNDPRIAQLIADQLRASYGPFYGYNPTAAMSFNQLHSYLQMPPVAIMPMIDVPRAPRSDVENGNSFRSALLEEFKNNNKTNKRFELKDIYDHVCEFIGDQHGSRFIQQKLETANSDEKERIFLELQPNAIQLMTDVFGNYVIQKFFEHGDQTQKKVLANQMKGQILTLSLQMYGCRVVQKALEHILVDQQASLVQELEHNVLKCVKDQNGNHVVQKAIERCPPQTIRFILNAFVNQVQHLSVHSYGCRVIQRCLEHCEPADKRNIMSELHDGMIGLVGDQYGNYVVQHVVEHGTAADRLQVLNIVSDSLESYSKHKFASNVVERCLYFADDGWRRCVIHKLIAGGKREGESTLLSLIRDQYGNYVIQKLLDVVSREDFAILIVHLQPELNIAKRTGCGKQVISIEKKMHRFSPANNQFTQYAQPFVHRNGNGVSPPSLTVNAKPFHSSKLPNMNGDASAGASNGRKGSEANSERSFRG